ncbi:MAG: large subunit ribosomal protein L10 [Patiriisocius sp.]|jgi:large subunit ribosomal protein L10
MNKEEKNQFIDQLASTLGESPIVYLADTSELNADDTSKLRRSCHKQGITLQVVKNTLLKRAMDQDEGSDYSELYDTLKGATSLMFADVANAPAKLIKDFRKTHAKPILKGAIIEDAIYIGDENLTALSEIKSKEEMIGDIIALLQSPIKNVLGSLQSSGQTISGLLKTLEERAN